jgi:DNA-binding HxlR family transcriptional regulator
VAPRVPDCPLARTVEHVGAWPTLEILHELFEGVTSCEEIGERLQVPNAVLQQRLAVLVERGLLEPYDVHPGSGTLTRCRLTQLGRSLRPVLLMLAAWGNHRLAPDQRSMILVDRATGVEVEPVVVDRLTGRRVDGPDYVFAAGPAASATIRWRYTAGPPA